METQRPEKISRELAEIISKINLWSTGVLSTLAPLADNPEGPMIVASELSSVGRHHAPAAINA